ncbi:hypothetical protein A3841_00965 [Pontibacter flavimaris]|uniref:dTDP-4-amino-4,6-dideoxygalactose transaminase n=2 Tax=Pontibacter flavimaris TaxID=1797110 RepID=A0A1Q5PBB0_9BACT|nr:hypothetical protein A3841_00965 [Pontibacter flavimaris]
MFTPRFAIWPTLPLDIHFRTESTWRPFPLNQENCRIFSRARQAIWSACIALDLKAGDTVLVPAYHHGSEIEALLLAGLKVKYYEIDGALAPDEATLLPLLDKQVKALYLIHYLGFPQDGAYWRKWCDDRNLLLMEDAAQAFLSTKEEIPVGSHGHVAVFCLYKTYGIPDGGAVISIKPPAPPRLTAETGNWRILKRHLNWVATKRGEVGFLHGLVKPALSWWKRQRDRPHAEFEMGNPDTPPALMTTRLLPKLLNEVTAHKRRRNYQYLLDHLGEMVPRQFVYLPDGACPFAFPIEVENARPFLERLRQKGVLGLLFWINPHPTLPVEEFPRSRFLRERVLALPVHQELTEYDLKRIVSAVQESRTALPAQVAAV